MTDKGMAKAVIYSRVATHGMVTCPDMSLPGQERRCRNYAIANGYTIVETFRDIGSGIKGDRPAMSEMLRFLEAHRGENIRVLITDPQRLARKVETFHSLDEKICEAGGKVEMLRPSCSIPARSPRARPIPARERER